MDSLKHFIPKFRERLDALLPTNTNSRLAEAMRYSAMADGKAIRPFLLFSTASMFGVESEAAMTAAVALELIHCYSLIHDDLPAMDNDDFRRGQASSHKKFDEATAILAGDALLTYAFELAADPIISTDAEIRCLVVKSLAQASGFAGMVGGQMMDIEGSAEREEMQLLKTGSLFVAACSIGAILGKATPSEHQFLTEYATNIGLAFQIRDDIEDESNDGIANDRHKILISQAKICLESLNYATDHLCEIANLILL